MATSGPPPPEQSVSKKAHGNALVMTSLSHALDSALPVALSDSTPTNPLANHLPTEAKKSSKLKLPDLLAPSSRHRKRSDSDDSPTSPSSPRRWTPNLVRKKKLRVRGESQVKSADSSPSPSFDNDDCNHSKTIRPLPLETTPVDSLPGQLNVNKAGNVPLIMVSPEDEDGGMFRKTSQCSHLSAASSTVTSGGLSIGSLLSPSGDEDLLSDQESPLSPLSNASSINGSRENVTMFEDDTLSSSSPPGTDGETDYIDADFPPSSPSHYPSMQHALTIPTPAGGGKEKTTTQQKKKKWAVIRKAVQWSPFVQVYRKKYPWVQLAGHQGNFSPGQENGTIIKKSSADEARALRLLMDDILRPFVPEYRREFTKEDSELYIEMADLLRDFDNPSVMDIKMGTRTYLEDELTKARVKEVLRPDMYDKMIAVDSNEPTEAEHAAKAITKPRYMQWRETLSSTATLGFRIEGIKMSKDKPLRDEFKTVRCREDVHHHLRKFIKSNEVKCKMLDQLKQVRSALEKSVFFLQHEVIGSSLLFVYDSNNQARVSIIDFGKTIPLPDGCQVDHRRNWEEGNHEDGYLFGLDNLIDIWETL